jgi:hypothetical protein
MNENGLGKINLKSEPNQPPGTIPLRAIHIQGIVFDQSGKKISTTYKKPNLTFFSSPGMFGID